MLSEGSIIGRQHRLMNRNCQDFVVTGSPKGGYLYGVVLDGCGGKYREMAENIGTHEIRFHRSNNEVGAKLLGQFIGQWLDQHLVKMDKLVGLPDKLQLAAERFLLAVVNSMGAVRPSKQRRFIHTNLLTTIVGFAITPGKSCFFWVGDGFLLYNDEIFHLDCNNQPSYLAYQLDPTRSSKDTAYSRMQFREMPVTNEPHQVAVATDGWQIQQLQRLHSAKSSLELQRWINVEAREQGSFEDDGAIAMWVQDDV